MTIQLIDLVQRPDGHDGSHYQVDQGNKAGAVPPVDLDKLKATPMDWLGWKVSQSTAGRDATFPDIDKQAARLDFRNFFGYGWLSSTTDPFAQADNFLNLYGKKRIGKGAMIDAEEKLITVDMFCKKAERIEEELKQPCVGYTGIYVAGGTIFTDPRVRMSAYGLRPMIVAAYVKPADLYARLLQLGLLKQTIEGWQWSSNGVFLDGTQLPGIVGRADIDAVLDWAAMDLACGRPIPTPQPTPGDDEVAKFYTNSETYNGEEPKHAKFLLTPENRLRPASVTILKVNGVTNSLDLGDPLTNDEIDSLGIWTPDDHSPITVKAPTYKLVPDA